MHDDETVHDDERSQNEPAADDPAADDQDRGPAREPLEGKPSQAEGDAGDTDSPYDEPQGG